MTTPSLFFVDLHDEKYRFDKYWTKLESTDIRTPKSKIIQFEDIEGSAIPSCPTKEIQHFMESNDYNKVFLRSGYKAAIDRFREGSIIYSREKDQIENTFESLIRQHIRNDIKHGDMIVVREYIPLDYCMEPTHSHRIEVRYFVEDGEIIARTPRGSKIDPIPDCSLTYSFVKNNLNTVSPPDDLALTVAEEFEDSKYPWSIDFVLDNRGRWWATEMHINGVYYNHKKEKWWNVCGHGECEEFSPLWIHSAAIDNYTPIKNK
jgi:hypothetical protein